MAVKVLESVHEIIEEIEEEYLVLRDHGRHPNLPSFFGIFMYKSPRSADQLWIAMEVTRVYFTLLGLLPPPEIGGGNVLSMSPFVCLSVSLSVCLRTA